MQRSLAVLGVLAVLAGACTSGTADPSPTPSPVPSSTAPASPTSPPPGRVAVVVAPDPTVSADVLERGTRRAVAGVLGDVELRVAAADDPSFVQDLTTFFTTEGYDLVCAVGAGAADAVRRVAATSPSTRFCAAPAAGGGLPPNVLPITVRVEELGYLAGVALAADELAGPAALLTGPGTLAPARIRRGLRAGLADGGVASPTVRSVGPLTEDTDGLVDRVTGLLGDGVGGILSLAGVVDDDVRQVLEEVPVTPPPAPGPTGTPSPTATPTAPPTEPPDRFAGLVAGPVAPPSGDDAQPSELLLAVVELHLEQAVAVAIRRHVDGWDTSPASVGLAEDAFTLTLGPGARGQSVAGAVDQAATAIRDGEREVPAG